MNYRQTLLLLLLLCFFSGAKSQDGLLSHPRQVNGGLAIGKGLPVYLGFDQFVHKDITAGISLAYTKYEMLEYGAEYHQSAASISINGNYHFNRALEMASVWDLFVGLNAGMLHLSSPHDLGKNEIRGPGIGIQFGGRYFVTHHLAVNVEAGGGYLATGIRFGITYRL